MTRTEFLLARVAEDQVSVMGVDCPCGEEGEHTDPTLPHCPARVLAECQAKRDLVNLLSGAEFALLCHPESEAERGHVTGIKKAVQLAALPYADHPDYDEAWRP